jgi:hypothetical protein
VGPSAKSMLIFLIFPLRPSVISNALSESSHTTISSLVFPLQPVSGLVFSLAFSLHAVSFRQFLVWLIFRPWSLMLYILPKRRLTSTKLQNFTFYGSFSSTFYILSRREGSVLLDVMSRNKLVLLQVIASADILSCVWETLRYH